MQKIKKNLLRNMNSFNFASNSNSKQEMIYSNKYLLKVYSLLRQSSNLEVPLINSINNIKGFNYSSSLFLAASFGHPIQVSLQKVQKSYTNKERMFFYYKYKEMLLSTPNLSCMNNYDVMWLEKKESFQKLKVTKEYKSFRFKNGYPLRGQRTKTNAKTRKKHRII